MHQAEENNPSDESTEHSPRINLSDVEELVEDVSAFHHSSIGAIDEEVLILIDLPEIATE